MQEQLLVVSTPACYSRLSQSLLLLVAELMWGSSILPPTDAYLCSFTPPQPLPLTFALCLLKVKQACQRLWSQCGFLPRTLHWGSCPQGVSSPATWGQRSASTKLGSQLPSASDEILLVWSDDRNMSELFGSSWSEHVWPLRRLPLSAFFPATLWMWCILDIFQRFPFLSWKCQMLFMCGQWGSEQQRSRLSVRAAFPSLLVK